MRKHLLPGIVAAVAVLGATLTLRSVETPAATVADSASRSACHFDGPLHPFGTYLQADNESTLMTGTQDTVTVTADASGSAHDCGPAGHATPVADLTIQVEFLLRGTKLCYPETVNSRAELGPVEMCSPDGDKLTVTHEFLCRNEATCRLSVSHKTFRAAIGGRISGLETRSIVTSAQADGLIAVDRQVLSGPR